MDIEVDCEDYRSAGDGTLHLPHSDCSSKKLSVDDQVDSGLGSMGYFSSELISSSFCSEVDLKGKLDHAVESPQLDVIESSFSKLIISNTDCKDLDRFDSGLESEKLSEITDSQVTDPYFWVSPYFSPEEIVDIFTGDEDGDNHLHMSIIQEIPEVTMQIIGLALNWDWLNQTNNLLQTPLHIAVITRQVPIVRRLMCAGASVEVRDRNGNTPLHCACMLGYEDVVRTLVRPVELEETLQNKYNIPSQRLPQDLDSRNYEGLTSLHLAAEGGHIGVMQMLLSTGAQINAVEGKSGRTVLHMAAEWGNMTMIRFLLSQQGINVNARTYAGFAPIHLAYGRKSVEVVKELLRCGAFNDTLSLSELSDGDITDDDMV